MLWWPFCISSLFCCSKTLELLFTGRDKEGWAVGLCFLGEKRWASVTSWNRDRGISTTNAFAVPAAYGGLEAADLASLEEMRSPVEERTVSGGWGDPGDERTADGFGLRSYTVAENDETLPIQETTRSVEWRNWTKRHTEFGTSAGERINSCWSWA